MTKQRGVSWGSYDVYEGPFFHGDVKFSLPPNPSEDAKRLAVVTATEGGSYNAINMYDRCILSAGLIQWCEAGMYGVSSTLLGAIEKEQGRELIEGYLSPALALSGSSLSRDAKGRLCFEFKAGHTMAGVVDRVEEQRCLFLLNSTGHIGSWDDDSKTYATTWAMCMANLLRDPRTFQAHEKVCGSRLLGFVTTEVRNILWGPHSPQHNDGFVGAVRAAYISFAANLPAVASRMFLRAHAATKSQIWSPAWCISILHELTFGPSIRIYPTRYNAIRPVIERLYGVDLPDFATDLAKFFDKKEIEAGITTTDGVQRALLSLGYDLGPKGADGVLGEKTRRALMDFQRRNGLKVDGVFGPLTSAALMKATG